MVKMLTAIGLATLLAGCSDSERVGEPSNTQGGPRLEASAESLTGSSPSVHDTGIDPDVRNGISKTPFNGRAFTVDNFGSAPEGNALDSIRTLEPLARAGSTASYGIYLKISQCMPLMELGDKSRFSLDGKSKDECRDLGPEYLAARSDWLRMASGQGHLGAQLIFASDPQQVIGGPAEMLKNPEAVVEYKRQAMAYMQSAAERGSLDALMYLGNAYQIGVMSDQDNVTSHAYYLAAHRAAPGLFSTSNNRMQLLRNGLNAAQMAESVIKANEIYD